MAKTYTITSSSMNAGRRSSYSTNWESFQAGEAAGLVTGYSSAGYSSAFFRAVNIIFNSSDLNQFSGKTITSIVLRVTVISGKLGSSSYPYRVRYKYSGTATTASGGDAWASGNADSTAYSSTDVATWSNGQSSGVTDITANTTHDFNVGTTLPKYGYVIAGQTGNAYMTLASTATLIITTNESDYTYKLSYNANGGSGAPAQQSQTKTATSAPTMTFTISNTKPTYTGRTFKGWSTSSTATSASYQPGGSISISANTTLYAVWELITYTVSYNANGGSGAPSSQTKTYGVNLTLSSTIPTRTGYTFLGWSTSSTATSATYSAGGTYSSNADATLYAVWSQITYTVSYNANGGSGAPASQTKTYGVALTLSSTVPTRTGFNFDGWGTSASATSASYQPGGSYTSNSSITLFAVWSASGSAISAGNGLIGDSLVITITKQNPSYGDTITYSFGSASETIVTKTTNTSVTWSIPTALAQQIPNSTSGTCILTCTTYDGDTAVETSSITITLSIPSSSSWNPSISNVSLSEAVSGIASQFAAYVIGKSKINIQITAAGVQGSTITNCSVSINSQILNGTNVTTDFLNKAGSNSYTVTVSDSRNRTGTYTGSFSVESYDSPMVSITSITRDSTTETDCIVGYEWAISPVNNRNVKQYKVEYRENVSYASWNTAQSTTSLSSYTGTGTITIHNFDTGTSYQVRVSVNDYFVTQNYSDVVKPTDSWVIDVDPDDGSIGFHIEARGDGKDHFAKEVIFEDNVEIYEDLTVDGNVSSVGDISTDGAVYADEASIGAVSAGTIDVTGSISTSLGDLSLSGTIATAAPSAVSVATSTWKSVASISLATGRWYVSVNARFASNATGLRKLVVNKTQDSSSNDIGIICNDIRSANDNDYTFGAVSFPINCTETTVLYANVWQNSGSSLNTYGRMYAIQIC